MTRELRRVPADWKHPKNSSGNYVPLKDGFNRDIVVWDEASTNWKKGLMRKLTFPFDEWIPNTAWNHLSYIEWNGERPEWSEYMPDWPVEQRTHYQMYEVVSEGTPISPVMGSLEDIARWLADNEGPPFVRSSEPDPDENQPAYDQWLSLLKGGTFDPLKVF